MANTYGKAIKSPSTHLGRAYRQSADDNDRRIAEAQRIADAEGITLEEALIRVWADTLTSR